MVDYNELALNELKKQTAILDHLFNKSLYSQSPFASLLMSEVTSYEDMDGNGLLFGVDFIFDVPYAHLSPMLQNVCQMYWSLETESDYDHFRENPKDMQVLTFEQYRDSLTNPLLADRVNSYIKNYNRVLLKS